MQTQKIDENQIEITKEIPAIMETKTYSRDFIEQQIKDITAQRDEMITLKEKELKECQDILDAMDKLDIKLQADIVVEPIEVIEKI